MNKIKKIIITFLTLSIITIPVNASNLINIQDVAEISDMMVNYENIEQFKNTINDLDNNQFDELIIKYLNKEEDYDLAKNKLAQLNITVSKSDKIRKDNIESKSMVSARSNKYHFNAWDLDLSVYTVRRGGDSFYRILAQYDWSALATEDVPSSYDVLGISFDSSKASYYNYTVVNSNFQSLMTVSNASKGLILFNIYDSLHTGLYPSLTECVVGVYVTPKVSGEYIDVAAEYLHTFEETQSTYTSSTSIAITTPGLITASASFSISSSMVVQNWKISDTNAFLAN